jgi:hypothetical protein
MKTVLKYRSKILTENCFIIGLMRTKYIIIDRLASSFISGCKTLYSFQHDCLNLHHDLADLYTNEI